MNQTIQNPQSKRVAYIQAGWHKNIVEQAYITFEKGITEAGLQKEQIDIFDVPGSLEIPLQAKLLAKTGKYDIIVCCGLIVNGGIYRHDFVASTVLDNMMQVAMEQEIPVLSVVLTPHHFHGEEHEKFFFDHFKIKGKEAADACIQTLNNIEALQPHLKVA